MFDDATVELIYEKDGFTLLDVVKPLSQGKGFVKKLEPRSSPRFRVDVIAGDDSGPAASRTPGRRWQSPE
jgi:hypothetical protein